MVIHSFDVPLEVRPLHFVHAGPGQAREWCAKVGYRGGSLLGRAESGDCLGCYWEGNSVWWEKGQGAQNVLQSSYPVQWGMHVSEYSLCCLSWQVVCPPLCCAVCRFSCHVNCAGRLQICPISLDSSKHTWASMSTMVCKSHIWATYVAIIQHVMQDFSTQRPLSNVLHHMLNYCYVHMLLKNLQFIQNVAWASTRLLYTMVLEQPVRDGPMYLPMLVWPCTPCRLFCSAVCAWAVSMHCCCSCRSQS